MEEKEKDYQEAAEAAETPKGVMEALVEKNSTKILEALMTRLDKEKISVSVVWGIPVIQVQLVFFDKAEFVFNIDTITADFALASKTLDSENPYVVISKDIIEYVLSTVHEHNLLCGKRYYGLGQEF